MTKADQIRECVGLPTRIVALGLDCDPQHVRKVWWKDRNREHVNKTERILAERRRRARGVPPRCAINDNPFWASRDADLVAMVKADVPRRLIAERLGTTKNAVIGRWHRLVEAGLA